MRLPNDHFSDSDLANILYKATEESAGFFRTRGTPIVMKVVDVMGMMQARSWKSVPNISRYYLYMNLTFSLHSVCTLNELRKCLGLESELIIFYFYFSFLSREARFTIIILAFKSYEDWNAYPDIANAARGLYGVIDRLELYPGLHAEGHAEDGFGQQYSRFRVSTVRNGLLFDAIALVWPFLFYRVMTSEKEKYHCRSVIQVLPLNSLVQSLFPHLITAILIFSSHLFHS